MEPKHNQDSMVNRMVAQANFSSLFNYLSFLKLLPSDFVSGLIA
jgi:hypothetical protein